MKKIACLLSGLFVLSSVAFSALIVPDSYDKLFLKMNGTTTTFTDEIGKTVTANGNVTQLSYKFNKTAGFFDGSSWVEVPNSSDFNFGTGNFTVEFWVNFNDANGRQQIVSYNGDDDFSIGLDVSENTSFYIGGTAEIEAAWTPSANTWYHVACVRSGTDVFAFVNGTQVGSTASSSFNITDSGSLTIGKNSAGTAHYFKGWLKELRVSNSARYTSNFTPSTTQFSADSNTKLLLHFDSPAKSPLAPAIHFPSYATDYIDLADSDDWTPQTNFTAEGWFRYSTVDNGAFLGQEGTAGNRGWRLIYNGTLAGFSFQISDDGTNWVTATYAGTPSANTWYHVAGVKNGNTLTVFVNGVAGSTTGDFTGKTAYASTARPFVDVAGGNGCSREIRVSNVARYTTAFTPSQTGFTVDSNTKLYIKGSETNGATTFIDSETSPKTVTTNGDAKIKYTEDYRSGIFIDSETTAKYPYPQGSAKVDFIVPFGSGVGYLDGSGDYLSLADSSDWDMGEGDFSVGLWFRTNVNAATYSLFLLGTNYTDGITLSYSGNSTSYTFDGFIKGTRVNKTLATPPVYTWHHIELDRASGTAYSFFDGTLLGTTSATGDVQVSAGIQIGSNNPDSYFNGLVDNIRVSKGVARNTATFNPPEDYQSINGQMLEVF